MAEPTFRHNFTRQSPIKPTTMLETERLILKEISPDDLDCIHALHSIPETDRYNTLGIPQSLQQTETLLTEWLAEQNKMPRSFSRFSIFLKDTGTFIGLTGLNIRPPKYRSSEIWYKFDIAYWKMGYATETVRRILKYGFETLNLHRMEAGCDVDNKGSIAVLEKVGMTREGRKRKSLPIRGEWHDSFSYAILEEDFRKKQ